MDRRALKPAVEPLSQRTWQTIETRVFEQLDQPAPALAPSAARPVLALGLAGLALAASLLALLQSSGSGQRAEPREPAPMLAPVAASPAAPSPAAPSPAAPSQPASAELSHIVTAAAPSQAQLGDSQLTVAQQSDVRIEGSDAQGWRVLLERGEVGCEVAPRVGRPPFVVSAGDVQVRVVGTRFSVVRRASGTRVSVEAGHVQVEHAGTSVSVGPGESWPAARALPRERSQRPDAQREFERAAGLESSDPARALAIYARLARRAGPWAANALYARARLLVDEGRQQDAQPLLERYLEKYPQGANAADARRLLESQPAPIHTPR